MRFEPSRACTAHRQPLVQLQTHSAFARPSKTVSRRARRTAQHRVSLKAQSAGRLRSCRGGHPPAGR